MRIETKVGTKLHQLRTRCVTSVTFFQLYFLFAFDKPFLVDEVLEVLFNYFSDNLKSIGFVFEQVPRVTTIWRIEVHAQKVLACNPSLPSK